MKSGRKPLLHIQSRIISHTQILIFGKVNWIFDVHTFFKGHQLLQVISLILKSQMLFIKEKSTALVMLRKMKSYTMIFKTENVERLVIARLYIFI